MICAHGIHFLDLVAERHRVVHEQLDKVAGRRLAGEQLELGVDGVSPSEHDTEGDLAGVWSKCAGRISCYARGYHPWGQAL